VIIVDTSALLAILLKEPGGPACFQVLTENHEFAMSAGTLTEALIVSSRRNQQADLKNLLTTAGVEIVPVTSATAQLCAEAHLQWGKGIHPAGLNFGDCFAYALAKERNCPLLFVGNDFSQTDIASAISA
jgi:ribonuclease VapC